MESTPTLKLLSRNLHEVISLDEVKVYLRIAQNSDDDLLASLIKVAANMAETYTQISLSLERWQATYHQAYNDIILLPVNNLIKINSVVLIHGNGHQQQLSEDFYIYGNGRVKFKHLIDAKELVVTYQVGFEQAGHVPMMIKQGMLFHIAIMYEQRTGSATLSENVIAMYQPFRKIRI